MNYNNVANETRFVIKDLITDLLQTENREKFIQLHIVGVETKMVKKPDYVLLTSNIKNIE